jgi:hypothetical protein
LPNNFYRIDNQTNNSNNKKIIKKNTRNMSTSVYICLTIIIVYDKKRFKHWQRRSEPKGAQRFSPQSSGTVIAGYPKAGVFYLQTH